MKKCLMLGMLLFLLAGCQTVNQKEVQSYQSEESKTVEVVPRFIGSYNENILEKYATRVKNLQNSTGTYDYFTQGHFYGNGRPVEVTPGGKFNGITINLKKNETLLVELATWNESTWKSLKTLYSRTITNGLETSVDIPKGAGKFYVYHLAIKNGNIVKHNYFPLYTPVNENNMIATASKQVYRVGEVASIYYENWGMNEIQTGSPYFIYKKTKNGWERMNKEQAFTDILMNLGPTAIHVEHIDLKGLKEGSYKIIKGFYRDIRMGNTGFQLGVEFKISNKESK